jgi:hypothetical protein
LSSRFKPIFHIGLETKRKRDTGHHNIMRCIRT